MLDCHQTDVENGYYAVDRLYYSKGRTTPMKLSEAEKLYKGESLAFQVVGDDRIDDPEVNIVYHHLDRQLFDDFIDQNYQQKNQVDGISILYTGARTGLLVPELPTVTFR